LPCAPEWKRRESWHDQKAERNTRERFSIFMCDGGLELDFASWLQLSARTASKRFGNSCTNEIADSALCIHKTVRVVMAPEEEVQRPLLWLIRSMCHCDEPTMRRVIANGVRGTSMPAFAQSAGGMLTDKQIDVITSNIRSRWAGREFSTEPTRLLMPRSSPATLAGRSCLWNLLRVVPRHARPRRTKGQHITNDSF